MSGLRPAAGVRGPRFRAGFDGECDVCGDPIDEGEPIGYVAGTSDVAHEACADDEEQA